jgi:hypothetical protein
VRGVLEILHALSLTSTILLVGYSLDDPDIQLALQAVGRGQLDPEAHYMLSPEPATPSRIPVYRASFGVTVLTYPAGAHEEVHENLTDLGARVSSASLDVLIGLFFLFFLLSIVCSAINEGIATALGLRAKTLEQGIRNLLASDAAVAASLRRRSALDSG